MYRHILIPTDGSPLSQNAVEYGIALAKAVKAKITVLTVSEPYRTFAMAPELVIESPEQYRARMESLAMRYLEAAKGAASDAGVTCDVLHLEHEQPYKAIIDTAVQARCDLIVMASHGRRGISALVLGSETVKVLTHSTIPVLVFRSQVRSPLSVAS